jgi:hypothetical protein
LNEAQVTLWIRLPKNEKSQIMAKVVEDVELIMVPLPLMDKWMMQHRWVEFVIDAARVALKSAGSH